MIGSKEVSMMVKKEERNKLSWNFVLTRLTIIDRHVRGVLRLRLLLTSWRDRRPWLYHNLGDFELLVKRVGLTLGIGELAFGVGSRTKIRT